jgi:hypothetical protein
LKLDDICVYCYIGSQRHVFKETFVNTRARSVKRMLLLAAVLGTLAAPRTFAQPTPLFSDDFGPKPLASWQASPLGLASNWDASSGAAAYNGDGHTQLYAGSAAWTDYRVQVKVKVDTSQDYPGGIRGRVDVDTGAGYAVWIYPGQGLIKLFRATAWNIDTSGLTLLAQTGATIAPGVDHTLALAFSGSQIAVEYDGSTVITATDSTLSAGAVALDVSNQPIAFDDVAVTSGATTLFADDFSPRPLRAWASSPLGLASNWGASSGAAAYNGGGHTQLYAGSAAWTDYKVEAKFRLANGGNYPGGLRGRVNPATGESYAAWIYPADGVVKLFRVVAWHIDTSGLQLLAQANVGTISSGVFHTLALTFQGSSIHVAYDGADVVQATDTAFAAGAIALDVSNQPIDFDDVSVTPVAAPPPPSLLSDDFSGGLAGWTPSPLGLFSNWSGAAGTASYNGGGHTQIYAGLDRLRGGDEVPARQRQQPPGRPARPGEHHDRRVLCRLDLSGGRRDQALPRRRLGHRHPGPGPAGPGERGHDRAQHFPHPVDPPERQPDLRGLQRRHRDHGHRLGPDGRGDRPRRQQSADRV